MYTTEVTRKQRTVRYYLSTQTTHNVLIIKEAEVNVADVDSGVAILGSKIYDLSSSVH